MFCGAEFYCWFLLFVFTADYLILYFHWGPILTQLYLEFTKWNQWDLRDSWLNFNPIDGFLAGPFSVVHKNMAFNLGKQIDWTNLDVWRMNIIWLFLFLSYWSLGTSEVECGSLKSNLTNFLIIWFLFLLYTNNNFF